MRIAGMRLNLMWIGAAIAVALLAIFFFAGHNTPSATAEEFLEDLAHGDSAKLVDVTYVKSGDKAALQKAYEFATQEAGKNYSFLWRIKDEREADANTASVQISVVRNPKRIGSYEENFEIPLIRQNGKWLVDVASISSLLYPALPK